MSISAETWREQAACKTRPDLFHATVLDYDAADEEWAGFSPEQHEMLAAEKARVEAAAVSFCFGCPVVSSCAAWALSSGAHGVAGAMTEADRAKVLTDRNQTIAEPEPLKVSLRDRGPRGQIDDEAVVRMTALNWNSARIARELDCVERTVVRARARIARKSAEAARKAAAAKATPTTTPALQAPPVAPVPVPTVAVSIPAPAPQRTPLVFPAPAGRPQAAAGKGPRTASAAMQAIYATLADGQWHDRNDLVAAAIAHVPASEALEWWLRTNSVSTGDGAVLPEAKATVPEATRIAQGARDKVNNMLSASARNAKRTERGGPDGGNRDLYRVASRDLVAV